MLLPPYNNLLVNSQVLILIMVLSLINWDYLLLNSCLDSKNSECRDHDLFFYNCREVCT